MNRRHSKECARIKQFFTTLQTFANNTSPEVAEQVQELITALINGLATVEEFHQEIQQATNYPLKEFVIVFLKVSWHLFLLSMCHILAGKSEILPRRTEGNERSIVQHIHF
jgi:runt-related transcription factor 1